MKRNTLIKTSTFLYFVKVSSYKFHFICLSLKSKQATKRLINDLKYVAIPKLTVYLIFPAPSLNDYAILQSGKIKNKSFTKQIIKFQTWIVAKTVCYIFQYPLDFSFLNVRICNIHCYGGLCLTRNHCMRKILWSLDKLNVFSITWILLWCSLALTLTTEQSLDQLANQKKNMSNHSFLSYSFF